MAKATLKSKTAAAPAAQSREEVERLIEAIGRDQRELQRQDANLGDRLAEAKRWAEESALPLKEQIADAQDRVSRWCEANREELTRGGKTKTVEFTTGKVSWRLRPPAVTLRKIEDIIAYLRGVKGGPSFLRVKEEVNKDALLAAPQFAATVPGVKIGSAGEDFIVEPFGGDLVEAV